MYLRTCSSASRVLCLCDSPHLQQHALRRFQRQLCSPKAAARAPPTAKPTQGESTKFVPPYSKGQEVVVDCVRLSHNGIGVCFEDEGVGTEQSEQGCVLFVKDTVPGEKVLAHVYRVRAGFDNLRCDPIDRFD